MNFRWLSVFCISICCFVQFAACHSPSQQNNNTAADAGFSGFITEVKTTFWGKQIIYAENHANKIVTRWKIYVKKETKVLRKNGESLEPIGFTALQPKDRIQVWFYSKEIGDSHIGLASQVMVTSREGGN